MLRPRAAKSSVLVLCLLVLAGCGDDGPEGDAMRPDARPDAGAVMDGGGHTPGVPDARVDDGGGTAGSAAGGAGGTDASGAGAGGAGTGDAAIADAGDAGDPGDAQTNDAGDAGDAGDASADAAPNDACTGGSAETDDGCTELPPDVTDCGRDLTAVPGEVCSVNAGNAVKLITGDILLPDAVLRGGQVLIDASGSIACVACDCSGEALATDATEIICPDGAVSPGLINAHDHLTFDYNTPPVRTAERFEQRHDWRVGAREHSTLSVPGNATADQLRWAELRFVLGGATATVSAGGTVGLIRNLDSATLLEALSAPAVRSTTFPLGDGDGTQRSGDCAYPNIVTEASIAGGQPFFAHVAEGIDGVARNEFACLSSSANGGQDLTEPQSVFVHGAALGAEEFALMAAEGTALVWSPRSNISLYGDTAQVSVADALGVRIALGTDWTPSGSMNMLRELHCAASWSRTYLDGYFSDQQLFRMATVNGAVAAHLDQTLGVLASGHQADLAIFDAHERADYAAVVAAEPADVALVMRSGKVLYGDEALVEAIPGTGDCDELDVCTVDKRVCLQSEIGKTLAMLDTSAASTSYPLFDCDEPLNEPTCVPSREGTESVEGSSLYTGQPSAGDADGDGIEDALDDCARVFNPIRPVDQGAQADADGDMVGDACDICPLDADSTSCTPVAP